MAKFKASIERGNPPDGIMKVVVSLKSNKGGRWEFVGKVPKEAAYTMQALCVSHGRVLSLRLGYDEGIERAFGGAA